MDFKPFFERFTLSDKEEGFLREAGTATTADMNQSQVASSLYFAKTLEDVADKLIKLNDKIETANSKSARLMVLLTFGILLTGLGVPVVALGNQVVLFSYFLLLVLAIAGLTVFTFKQLF